MDVMVGGKAIGYVRVSRVGGSDGFLSPALQRESIERVCQREGFKCQTYARDGSAR
jgi:hypothetical protein